MMATPSSISCCPDWSSTKTVWPIGHFLPSTAAMNSIFTTPKSSPHDWEKVDGVKFTIFASHLERKSTHKLNQITMHKPENVDFLWEPLITRLHKKHKNQAWILSGDEAMRKANGFFSGRWSHLAGKDAPRFALESGVAVFDGHLFFFGNGRGEVGIVGGSLREVKRKLTIVNATTIKVHHPGFEEFKMEMSPPEVQFLHEFLDLLLVEAKKKCYEMNQKLQEESKDWANEFLRKTKSLVASRIAVKRVFDRDGNGIIDVIEGEDDFMNLLKKHQKKVIEIDKQYVQVFIKLGNYLKSKRQNLQSVYLSIDNIDDESSLPEFEGLLKNQIHTYEALLLHSLSMITAVSEDDLITFYEIYEAFDKLSVFNSNWENELSQKLSNIGHGLSGLMRSVETMERNIVNGLNELTYHTKESFSELSHSITKELQSINSSVEFNSLLTGISTYQLYKINKQTKGLTE